MQDFGPPCARSLPGQSPPHKQRHQKNHEQPDKRPLQRPDANRPGHPGAGQAPWDQEQAEDRQPRAHRVRASEFQTSPYMSNEKLVVMPHDGHGKPVSS